MMRAIACLLLVCGMVLGSRAANAQSTNTQPGLTDPFEWPPVTTFSFLWDRKFRISATFTQTAQRGAISLTRNVGLPAYWCELGSYRINDQPLPYNVCVRL